MDTFKKHKCKVQWGSNPQLQYIITQNKENISIISIPMQPVKMENIKSVNKIKSRRTWITKSLMCSKTSFSYQLKWKVNFSNCHSDLVCKLISSGNFCFEKTTSSPLYPKRQKQTKKSKQANLNDQNKTKKTPKVTQPPIKSRFCMFPKNSQALWLEIQPLLLIMIFSLS